MRILHLTDRLTDRGGAPRHLLSILRAQAERGHEVHLAAGAVDALAERVHAQVRRVAGLESRTAAAVDLDPLWRTVAADVTHVHTIMNPIALAEAAARDSVFTVQDHRAFCPARGKWTAAGEVCRHTLSRDVCAACFDDAGYFEEMLGLTGARRTALRRAHAVVLSEYMRGELVLAGLSADRVHVVPPFVNLDDAPASATAGPPCVLFVGRLVAAKGPLEAIEAWRRSGVPLPLVVAGTGPLREAVEAAGAEVLGWVPHDRLAGLLRRARALLMPSRWQEPFGIAGLEALSLGVPVVAWDSGGIREWHPGPLVPWGDIDGLSVALRSAAETRAVMPGGFARDSVMDRLERVYAMAGATPLPARPPLAPPPL